MGCEQKLLLQWRQKPIIQVSLESCLELGLKKIFVVTGYQSSEIEAILALMSPQVSTLGSDLDSRRGTSESGKLNQKGHFAKPVQDQSYVSTVYNPEWERGLGTSISKGMEEVNKLDCEGVFVTLGDLPLVKVDTMMRLCHAFLERPHFAFRPYYNGRPGHPAIFPKSWFKDLSQLKGDIGGSQVMKKRMGEVVRVDVNDPGIYKDIDSPADLDFLRKGLL